MVDEFQNWAGRAATTVRKWPPVHVSLDKQFVLGHMEGQEPLEARWPASVKDPGYALSHLDIVSRYHTRSTSLDKLIAFQIAHDMLVSAVRYCKEIIGAVEEQRAAIPELRELENELTYMRVAGLAPANPDVNELLYPVAHALLLVCESRYTREGIRRLIDDVTEGGVSAISTLTITRSQRYLYVVVPGKVCIHLTVDEHYTPGEVYTYLSMPDSNTPSEMIEESDVASLARILARQMLTPGEALAVKKVAVAVAAYAESRW